MPASPSTPLTVCGSLSLHPVSLGASMHLAGYDALDLAFTYVPFAVSDDLPGAIRGMRALHIRGLGISMPFKVSILALVDEVDPLARRIGAANTVVNDDGRLTAYNTDCEGAVRALAEVTEIAGARILMIGAGGAARAVGFGLADAGARLTVANRSAKRGRDLAGALGAEAMALSDVDATALADIDVLVNASSAGMDVGGGAGALTPISAELLRPKMCVMDIVYKPVDTVLLRAARAAGARTVHGGRMLLHQAAKQFELYTGRAAPLDAMDRALGDKLATRRAAGA